ncbi:MAG: hypothetical protein IJ038_05215 [Clostridia bacterium]|nr:hypothetical protein [Clostridia bacterium]
MGIVTVSKSLKKAYQEKGFIPYEMYEASAEEFYDAITSGKQNNLYGMFVTRHELEDYLKMDTLLLIDKTAGIAVEEDGNIVSVFNGGGNKYVLRTMLPIAIEYGGCKLDNFNSKRLSAMYESYGFIPVAKVKFDRRFAPSDWNYERDGEPDIVFWIHNGDSASTVIRNFAAYTNDWSKIKAFRNYDEAKAYRDSLLNKNTSFLNV